MADESCGLCGGDGRVSNAFGGSGVTCPHCHGSGRRTDSSSIFRDVTKTKPSHHRPANAKPEAQKGPSTPEGIRLASDVQASKSLSAETKTRLIIDIMDHEASHGRCTQTFLKKVRKQVGPPA